jgi:hypothetical protein
MSKDNITASTKNRVATITMTSTQKAKVKKLIPVFYLNCLDYPADLKIFITKDEVISNQARAKIKKNILLIRKKI